jgi:penicillin-binding protein 1A
MALGAGSVTPMQMATAYSVFANGGYRVNPYLITRVTDHKDKVLVETQPPLLNESMRAIPQRNAFIMDSLLQSVASGGTAAKAQATLKRPDIYGKTGTTNDSLDAWFAGFQPTMTAIAWIGYDTPRKLGDRETGGGLSLPIWISFMETALKGVPVTEPTGARGRGQRRRRVVLRRLRPGRGVGEPGRGFRRPIGRCRGWRPHRRPATARGAQPHPRPVPQLSRASALRRRNRAGAPPARGLARQVRSKNSSPVLVSTHAVPSCR